MRTTERFKDCPWFREEDPERVVIGGCGGIGSFLSFFLHRAGFNIVILDDDRIEEFNLGGQLYKYSDVGKNKVESLAQICKDYGGNEVNAIAIKIDEDTCIKHPFMFAAFDNMDARKHFFNHWKEIVQDSPIKPILIDGRLEAEYMQILCVTPETMDVYEDKYLFDDDRVEDLACSMKQTTHAAAMIASYMTAFFTNHLTNIYEREVIREIPFFKEVLLPMNFSETIVKPERHEEIVEEELPG